LKRNVTIESGEQTNAAAIRINDNVDTGEYDSIYDEQILKRNKDNDLYKIIEINDSSWNGWIIAIYDPSRIKAVLSSNLKRGAKTTMMAEENDAVIAINGGGFARGNNKVWPTGNYIQNGEILYNTGGVGKLIGFNKDNVLVLLETTADEAIKQGVRDALEFRPFLVVNGVASTFKGDGGYGKRPRTAIGQRQDGIVLMIVIDGKNMGTGISMPDLTDLFIKYKAYNAANLDGGGSSTLVINKKLINSPAGWDYTGERWNVDAWIVK
jgi:exopolysaccharide biosynthesis protein